VADSLEWASHDRDDMLPWPGLTEEGSATRAGGSPGASSSPRRLGGDSRDGDDIEDESEEVVGEDEGLDEHDGAVMSDWSWPLGVEGVGRAGGCTLAGRRNEGRLSSAVVDLESDSALLCFSLPLSSDFDLVVFFIFFTVFFSLVSAFFSVSPSFWVFLLFDRVDDRLFPSFLFLAFCFLVASSRGSGADRARERRADSDVDECSGEARESKAREPPSSSSSSAMFSSSL
jgi:hypothetical protein